VIFLVAIAPPETDTVTVSAECRRMFCRTVLLNLTCAAKRPDRVVTVFEANVVDRECSRAAVARETRTAMLIRPVPRPLTRNPWAVTVERFWRAGVAASVSAAFVVAGLPWAPPGIATERATRVAVLPTES
jgi:hypothetical protein